MSVVIGLLRVYELSALGCCPLDSFKIPGLLVTPEAAVVRVAQCCGEELVS